MASNRRKHTRLRIDLAARVPVQMFPVLPFLGEAVDAALVNLSEGGMALIIERNQLKDRMPKGTKLKIHFRLPGNPLFECRGQVTNNIKKDEINNYVGVRFTKCPAAMIERIQQMNVDNDLCNVRIKDQPYPWCDPSCSFFSLCRKPLREGHANVGFHAGFEIAFQGIT